MGQCWTKHRKGKKGRPAHERYQPRQSESQQPIVNGVQVNDISAAVSSVSLDRSGTQHISERENAGECFTTCLSFLNLLFLQLLYSLVLYVLQYVM